MTDMERFIELYKSFGIELKAERGYKQTTGWEILLDGDTQPLFNESYAGFFSKAYFTEEGKFINQGFWE